MAQEEYEIISHNNTNYHIFLVNLLYRTPHIHKDYEISLVLDGDVRLVTPKGSIDYCQNDLFLINPYFSHEILADQPALILSLQVSPAFFSPYFPQIGSLEFDCLKIVSDKSSPCGTAVHDLLFDLALCYYNKAEYYPIRCEMLISQLFLSLLESQPHHQVNEKIRLSSVSRGNRMRKIMRYIDEHYAEKLLLSDIAQKEGLDLYYLSHFFKENFGISFQNYLTKVRCEQARQFLLLTDNSLLDICIQCGFSDPKYFNKGFSSQYGCTPKEYRKNFRDSHLDQQQKSMLTAQEFLSDETCCVMLKRYCSGETRVTS